MGILQTTDMSARVVMFKMSVTKAKEVAVAESASVAIRDGTRERSEAGTVVVEMTSRRGVWPDYAYSMPG